MINLSGPNIVFPNCNRWEVSKFDVKTGFYEVTFWAPAATLPFPPSLSLEARLSDAAGKSSGFVLNPTPTSWNDKFLLVAPVGPNGIGGVGVANAFSHARDAYRGAANHNAGLKAIEVLGVTDGWMAAAFAGT